MRLHVLRRPRLDALGLPVTEGELHHQYVLHRIVSLFAIGAQRALPRDSRNRRRVLDMLPHENIGGIRRTSGISAPAWRSRDYNQPFCRASRYASMRLPTPSLPIASDR